MGYDYPSNKRRSLFDYKGFLLTIYIFLINKMITIEDIK